MWPCRERCFRSGRRSRPERADRDDQYGQHGVPDERRALSSARQAARNPTSKAVACGPRDRRNRRQQHRQHRHRRLTDYHRSDTARRPATRPSARTTGAIRSATTSSILNGGGTGANWHFGVTAGYMRGQDEGHYAGGAFTSPNAGHSPSTRRPETFKRELAGSVCRHLYGLHERQPLRRRPGALGFLSEQPDGREQRSRPASGWMRAAISVTGNIGYNYSACTTTGLSSRRGGVSSVARADRSAQRGRCSLSGRVHSSVRAERVHDR